VSFSNDDEGDGLAALFGGVSPAVAAPGDPGPRRAAQAPAPVEPAEPAPGGVPASTETRAETAPTPGWSPASPTQYPGLAPAASAPAASSMPPAPTSPAFPSYAPPSPAAPPAPAYGAPAAPPTSPAYEMPAPAPAPSSPPPGPQSYDLPPPASAPSAPAWSPQPTPHAPAPQPTQQTPAPQPPPPFGAQQYGSPQPPPPYGAEQYASPQASPSYDLPAPEGARDLGAPPTGVAYPPTAQYPADLADRTAYPSGPPQGTAYPPPVAEPPSYAPPAGPGYDLPASAPAPLQEPPSAAPPLGYEAYARPSAPDERRHDTSRYDALPVSSPPGEHPLVLSEPAPPATVFPPGPLLPSSTAAVATPEDLERSTAGEKVGLVLALFTGPIGLAVAIANAVRGARRRGWLIGVVRVSLVFGVLSTIAAGIAGYVLWNIRLDQIAHAEVAAASAEFCAAADADPTMVTPPTLGWPAQGASVGESITLMQAWTDRWTTLAAESPAKLGTGMELLAETGQTIVDGVTTARVVDDAANQAQIAAAAGQSGVAGWYTTYCVTP
jgi:hypothetical protein